MAATKKNNTRKKTGTRSGSRNKKKQDEGIGLYTEIILWITLAGSILLLLSNFGMGGLVGKTVSGVFFGLFGLVAYIFPIFYSWPYPLSYQITGIRKLTGKWQAFFCCSFLPAL